MAVVLETSIGEITIDLYTDERPRCCTNFLKLCKIKYYNFCLFHSIQRNLVAQTGDPTGSGKGGSSVYEKIYGEQARFFDAELKPKIKHTKRGSVSMVNNGNDMHGSQFFITLGDNIDYLDGKHTVFGEVAEGWETIDKLNEIFVDREDRPYQDVRIYHTVVIDDPFDDPSGLEAYIPDRSPEPTKEQLDSGRIGAEEDIDDFKGKSHEEIEEILAEREAKANAQILEMVGDLPDADVKPPENVLFVCKLNPVTTDEDLEIIFSRFGKITSCEVIKDRKSGESLQYAFIEFEKEEECENAYFKMDNVLIDDRRIHVDFSQSVSKLKYADWRKRQADAKSAGPGYVIKDRARKDNYELVFSDKEDEGKDSKSKKKKKDKKKHKDKHSEKKPHTRDRSDSPPQKRHKSKERKRSRSRSREHKRSRDHRKSDYSESRKRDRSRERKYEYKR